MNFPPRLNFLRGTKLAWLLPFIWKVMEFTVVNAPITLEVFLHHRFGARSGKALLKGFLVLVVCLLIIGGSVLFSMFVAGYTLFALGHWLVTMFRNSEHELHSFSTGEPWPIWNHLAVTPDLVQQYCEPMLCASFAFLMLPFDLCLAAWIFMASIAHFVKQQVTRSRLRARRLDALDSRIEAERLTPRARTRNDGFVEARPAPPRPRN